ncbi:MAG TPA: membrane protein insertase YidC [Gaiellaceae bacterium]|nr:membrane protein insertase YidC [Gaiellaceae bacterium]
MILASPLTPLENVLRSILEWIGPHGAVGLPWGWSIIALTLMVRILLVPLTVKQIHSMQAMQAHMPEMKSIQKRFKDDKQKRNEELMRFYRDNNVNPAAPCLPILFQFPVFIALYLVLKHSNRLIHIGDNVRWLGFVPDITHHANAHWSGYVLLVVYVLSQLASTYFMSATMDKNQRVLMMILPVAFVPVLVKFPVGLVLYWVTTNLWTVGQGVVTRRLVPKKPAAPPKRSSRTPPRNEPPAGDGDGDGDGAEPSPPGQPARPPAAPKRVKRKKKQARR